MDKTPEEIRREKIENFRQEKLKNPEKYQEDMEKFIEAMLALGKKYFPNVDTNAASPTGTLRA